MQMTDQISVVITGWHVFFIGLIFGVGFAISTEFIKALAQRLHKRN